MLPGFVVRLRPIGPWRFGPQSGARDRVDRIFHSDSLFSAVTSAFAQLGMRDEWLAATVQAPVPAVVFSSCFPFLGRTLYVAPPLALWPPPPSARVRWKGARFVPLTLIESILREEPLDESKWVVDAESRCLVPLEKHGPAPGPFRTVLRTGAAVDRLTQGSVEVHSTACLEFAEGAGFWCATSFADEDAKTRWAQPLKSAFRLLADIGIGGERSRGWGRSKSPQFEERTLIENATQDSESAGAWWVLSLYSPSPDDKVDWTRGNYTLATRSGRVESAAAWGQLKRTSRLVEEGGVLFASSRPIGVAHDVAPENFSHPVYRSGFAFALPLPEKAVRPAGFFINLLAPPEPVTPEPAAPPSGQPPVEEPLVEPPPPSPSEPELEFEYPEEPSAEPEPQESIAAEEAEGAQEAEPVDAAPIESEPVEPEPETAVELLEEPAEQAAEPEPQEPIAAQEAEGVQEAEPADAVPIESEPVEPEPETAAELLEEPAAEPRPEQEPEAPQKPAENSSEEPKP